MPHRRQASPSSGRREQDSPRPIAGPVAERRRREARSERLALGLFLLLALTASGFAGHAISGGDRPYAVQALLPERITTALWPHGPAPPLRASLDPVTTGAIPDRRPAGPVVADHPEAGARGGYSLVRIMGGRAVLRQADGQEHEAVPGGDVPGAGRVLAIRNTGAGWVVITTQAIIGPTKL